MKIIEPGRDQRGWSQRAVCTGKGNGDGGCGAVLLVEIGDVYQTTSHHRDETDTFDTFACIQCGVETDIEGVPRTLERAKKPAWAGKGPP